MVKLGHRMQTALFYGICFLLIGFVALHIAITGINIMASASAGVPMVVFDPIGLPLFFGAILFFLSLAIGSSEHQDSKEG